ncbi:MAG TPA: hypothetical protein VF989_16220 [Polyangiaceae bacterium]
MTEPPSQKAPSAPPEAIDVFCSPGSADWRIYVRPTRLPRALRRCLDEHWEAVVEALDFDDLERQMANHRLEYQKRPSTAGGVQLVGHGRAAAVIAAWLSTALASGVRQVSS